MAAHVTPLQQPTTEACLNNLRPLLKSLGSEDAIASRLADIARLTLRISLRLFPSEDDDVKRRKHIHDGSTSSLLELIADKLESISRVVRHDSLMTETALHDARLLRNRRKRGYKVVIGEWRRVVKQCPRPSDVVTGILALLPELFDFAVMHPIFHHHNAQPEHPIWSLDMDATSISLELQDLTNASRQAKSDMSAIYKIVRASTSPSECALIIRTPPSSSGATSELSSTTPSPRLSRFLSFSDHVDVPASIAEHRCPLFDVTDHECESHSCQSSQKNDDSIEQISPETPAEITTPFRSTTPELMDLEPTKDAVFESPLSRTTSFDSPLAHKHLPLPRNFSLPKNCILGSAPPRKRTLTSERLPSLEDLTSELALVSEPEVSGAGRERVSANGPIEKDDPILSVAT